MRLALTVGFGSALGGFSRFLIDEYLLTFTWINSYTSLFLINVVGSYFIGLVLIQSHKKADKAAQLYWYFWGVGFCGGFTTFASFISLIYQGLVNASALDAAIYTTFSVLAGLLALVLGLITGQKFKAKA